MKIRVTAKDPDGIGDSVRDAVAEAVNAIPGLDDAEREAVIEERLEKVWDRLGKWLRYQEYLTVEFDTDDGTAVVVAER